MNFSRVWRRALVVPGLSLGGLAVPLSSGHVAPVVAATPPIRHVFVIVLENESAGTTFESADPYLGKAGALQSEGLYLPNYFSTGHVSNDNYVSMVSGQAPNLQNQTDCQIYTDFLGTGPLISGVLLPVATPLDGQAVGTGCVYPSSVQTVADQLTGTGRSWKGYMEDMGNDRSREAAVCGHPGLNTQDKTQSAEAPGPANAGQGDGYVTRHDPFVYFHSITDSAQCQNVVPLGSSKGDLPASAPAGTTGLYDDLYGVNGGTTPNLSFIVPDVCDDGHDFPCTNENPGGTSAVGNMDLFLEKWVPLITQSPAFKDGLLVVTFDEGSVPGDASSCCNELPGPGSPLPGLFGQGGGRVGAVLLSPWINKATTTSTSYNHYGLLGSIEDLFGLGRLGFAADVPNTFGSDVYNNASGTTTF